jgi:hypothetical protein
MQYYTRQQLQGSVRYGGGTLIGNWSEDRSIKETVVADFLAKADSKALKIDKYDITSPLRPWCSSCHIVFLVKCARCGLTNAEG